MVAEHPESLVAPWVIAFGVRVENDLADEGKAMFKYLLAACKIQLVFFYFI